jgi:adenylate kinase
VGEGGKMRLVLLGPPGSGKGTQAKRLSKMYNILRISTGEILRDEVRKETPLGKEARAFMEKGELVPDGVIIQIIHQRLRGDGGFILDGFPRNINQAHILRRMLQDMGATLDGVINLKIRDTLLIQRLSKRRVCKGCGLEYHLEFKPPREEGRCDRCNGKLYTRKDDEEDTVKNRLRVYKRESKSLIDYYRKEGILLEVDGELGIDEVFEGILRSIDRKR